MRPVAIALVFVALPASVYWLEETRDTRKPKKLNRESDRYHWRRAERQAQSVSNQPPPRQMRKVLTEKLRLDGIEPDAFVLKPNLSNLLTLRFRAINEQLGYKLSALLSSRFGGAEVRELLFGDDSEADALIYSLYADVISGELDRSSLAEALAGSKLYRRDVDHILSLVDLLPAERPVVSRIFIHLDRRSPTARCGSTR